MTRYNFISMSQRLFASSGKQPSSIVLNVSHLKTETICKAWTTQWILFSEKCLFQRFLFVLFCQLVLVIGRDATPSVALENVDKTKNLRNCLKNLESLESSRFQDSDLLIQAMVAVSTWGRDRWASLWILQKWAPCSSQHVNDEGQHGGLQGWHKSVKYFVYWEGGKDWGLGVHTYNASAAAGGARGGVFRANLDCKARLWGEKKSRPLLSHAGSRTISHPNSETCSSL